MKPGKMSAVSYLGEQFRSPHSHGGDLVRVHSGELPRCTTCGHRTADPVTGEKPVQTRTEAMRNPLRAFNEIPRRKAAMRYG